MANQSTRRTRRGRIVWDALKALPEPSKPTDQAWLRGVVGTVGFLLEVGKTRSIHGDPWVRKMREHYGRQVFEAFARCPESCKPHRRKMATLLRQAVD